MGCFIAIFLAPQLGVTQVWNLPTNKKNTRHSSVDNFNIPRPALSIRGFDNESSAFANSYSSKTFGVKQLLKVVYGIDGQTQNSESLTIFQDLVNLYDDNFAIELPGMSDSQLHNVHLQNARIFEARAFVALMTYIIELNDSGANNFFTTSVKSEVLGMPTSHSVALDSLKIALSGDNTRYYGVNEKTIDGSPFKSIPHLMLVARAWDFYLALENAYEDTGGNLNSLLTSIEKTSWNSSISSEIIEIWQLTRGSATW